MGTSVSQPSPRGLTSGGREWSSFQDQVRSGERPDAILSGMLQAYQSEFGSQVMAVLRDKGVGIVEVSLSRALKAPIAFSGRMLGQLMLEMRKELSKAHANSFLTELALISAGKILASPAPTLSQFSVEYVSRLLDYCLSRDIPRTIATAGVPDITGLENLLLGVKKQLLSVIIAPDEGLESFLSKVIVRKV